MAAEIGIIGTGAMGCLFGGYLSRRADVTLLTHRKQQAQAIEETGLSIQTDEGPVACGTLRAVCAAEVSEVFDLLVVFVKAFQTRDAIEGIRGCIGPETVILTLQNGIGNGQTLQQLFRPEQILVGTSTINSQRLSDTAVSQHGGMGITTIGSLCGKTALAEQTAAFFTSCGFCAEASTNIDGLIWKKACINLTINPLTALFDRPIGMVEQCEEAWALGRQEIAEAVQVANASGQSFSYEEVCDFVWQVLHGAREGTTSMRTDIRAGRPTEIAYLNGAVAALGKQYGIPTPYNTMMTQLIRTLEFTSRRS